MNLPVGEHNAIGPVVEVSPGLYDHGPTVGVAPSGDKEHEVLFCLDCGYTTNDFREFTFVPCDRDGNGSATTFREYINQHGYPEQEEADQ